jgi:Kdo2-lipid A phosphotransferase
MKWKSLLLCHLLIAFLLFSFFFPPLHALWQAVDTAVFKSLNSMMDNSRAWQLFWGLLNHKRADIVEDAIFLMFFIVAVYQAPPGEKGRRTVQFLFCIAISASIIYFVNEQLIRKHLLIPRASPSLVISPCTRLSVTMPWLLSKDATLGSFPGDHATTLLLFASFYTLYAGKKAGLYAFGYAILRILPRLVVGAHWLSDIVVGTISLVLFFQSWLFFTPLQAWIIDIFTRRKYEKTV